MDAAAATISPNPTEGVFKYTVVTTGRPVVDGLHHGDLPVPTDFLRKQGAEARLGKRQMAKLSSCGMLPPVKSRELRVHKKATIQPLDPTEMADYSPRTTTFVNGRPSLVSTPKQHPLPPTCAFGMPGPSHASPDSFRDASVTTRDDPEDIASVDSAPGTMRFLHPRSRPDVSSSMPDVLPNPRLALDRFPHDVVSSDENLDLYLEQFFPELHSMSDAELLRLMDPTPAAPSGPAPAAPALPTRPSTLAILQDMLLTQGSYAASTGPTLKPHASAAASNPPSGNWSSIGSDEQISHNWSDAPSQNWRSPRSPSPGPANWMSWPAATQSRKRLRSLDTAEDWPALAEHMPALSGEAPKRPMLQHPAAAQQQQAPAEHALDRQLLYRSTSSACLQPHAPQRPNPFALVSKQALMQPPSHLPRDHPMELQSYLCMQGSAASPELTPQQQLPHPHMGFSPTTADSTSHASCLDTIEPASFLEQALRDLRSKPDGLAC